jgi:hypothetical protein
MASRCGRFAANRMLDFFLPGAGIALDTAETLALIAVCCTLFCVVSMECFEKVTNLHPMYVFLSRSRAHHVVNIML